MSVATRHEVTKKYAKEYGRLSKKDKWPLLDELVAVTGLVEGERSASGPDCQPAPESGGALWAQSAATRVRPRDPEGADQGVDENGKPS